MHQISVGYIKKGSYRSRLDRTINENIMRICSMKINDNNYLINVSKWNDLNNNDISCTTESDSSVVSNSKSIILDIILNKNIDI